MNKARKKDGSIKAVGERIRRNRRSRRLTQEQVAERMGLDRATVSRYESGDVDIPVSALMKIGEVCGFEPKLLIPWEGDGLDSLKRLLEECAADAGGGEAGERKAEPGTEGTTPEGIELSDESRELIAAYDVLAHDPSVSKEALRAVGGVIIARIEIERRESRESLIRRLLAYLKEVNKINRDNAGKDSPEGQAEDSGR